MVTRVGLGDRTTLLDIIVLMASYQIAPPKRFTFSNPELWPQWARRFERFRLASELSKKSEEYQINTLVYAMGDAAEDILRSFSLSEEQLQSYKTVLEKFHGYFVKKRNVIFERARFNQRRQQEGESVDDFITSLHSLSEHCNYGQLREEMIRDRIVIGLCDSALSEKLQLESDLTLEKAITLARNREAVRKQQPVVRADTSSNIDTINYSSKRKGTKAHKSRCLRCGKPNHFGKEQCPAKTATCRKCHKRGHFQTVCRSAKSVEAVATDDDDNANSSADDEMTFDRFIGTIGESDTLEVPTVVAGSDPWTVTVSLNTQTVEFHIDTGADVTVIPEKLYKKLKTSQLQNCGKSLVGPSKEALNVLGKFKATLTHGRDFVEQDIYVVKGLRKPLIGRPAIIALQLVNRVNTINSVKQQIVDQNPDLFQGLGTIEEEYTIVLKADAKPYALATPRRIPIPLKSSVEQELKCMQQLGVICKVDEPTEWCAGMVVVPKSNGQVRICVDLTKLSQNVCRERHILPSVEQTLAQLQGAHVFSEIDANSGFWQIKLSKESALLTTFITPVGRFCFNRLPFGITSAPEFYQKKMSHILSGLQGVACMMDDVLVFGQTQAEHDRRLKAVLERIKKAGATLNAEKCEFSIDKVKFLGHVIDTAGIHPDPDKVLAIQQLKAPTNVTELRRFLGMVTYLGKFTSNLSQKVKPLRDLLSKKNEWVWGDIQQTAFLQIKHELSDCPVLALYDPSRDTMVSTDASSYGLGAVLTQQQEDQQWKPVAYASRALTHTEERYAQIEKEALGITWACERFSEYLVGMQFRWKLTISPWFLCWVRRI